MTEGSSPQGIPQPEVPQLTSGKVQSPEELRRQRTTIIAISIIVFIAVIIFVGLFIFLLNPNTPQIYVARIRDVFIIIFAIQSLFIGLVLVILMVQLARLTNLLQNEIKPILESTNETANTLRGTTAFLSDTVVEPVIKMNEYTAGIRQLLFALGLSRKK